MYTDLEFSYTISSVFSRCALQENEKFKLAYIFRKVVRNASLFHM